MIRLLVVALMLYLVPVAGAVETSGAEFYVTSYSLTADAFHLANINVAGEYINATYNASKRIDYEVIAHRLVIVIEVTAGMDLASSGRWQLNFTQDEAPLGACTIQIPTSDPGGFLSGDLVVYPGYTLHCIREGSAALDNVDHTHRYTLQVTVASGTPDAIDFLDVGVFITREDTYLVPQDANEILDTLAVFTPLLAFLIAAVWAEMSRDILVYILTVVAGITATVTLWEPVAAARMVLVGAILLLCYRTFETYQEDLKMEVE